jgi:ankyrin repeat protein
VAVLGDAVSAAKLLLDRGANVGLPEEGGFQALHLAVETGDARLVELLLDHGADIHARAEDGTTPRWRPCSDAEGELETPDGRRAIKKQAQVTVKQAHVTGPPSIV